MLIIFFSLLLNIHFKKTTCYSFSRVPEGLGSAVPITFTQFVVGSSRKLPNDQLGPKSCMAQRIIHINKSHVAKVAFTARDGAGRRPLTSWRRIYFTNTPLPCLSGAHCHLVNRSSVHRVLAGIQRKAFDKQSPPEMYIAQSTTDQRHNGTMV